MELAVLFLSRLIFPGSALSLAALAVELLLQQPNHLAELFIFALFRVDCFGSVLHPLFKFRYLLRQFLTGTGDLFNLFLQFGFRLGSSSAHVVYIF